LFIPREIISPEVVGLSGEDVQAIREDLVEVKQSIGELTKAVTDLRVLVAGNYITKAEFTEHQKIEEARVVALHNKIDNHEKSERAERWKIFGAAMTVAAFVFGVIQWIVSLFSKMKG
jgi:hypothetical protein